MDDWSTPLSATLLSNGTVLIDDGLRSQAETLVDVTHERGVSGIVVSLEDGRRIELGADLAQFFIGVLERLAHGPVTVMTLPDELTTTTAAGLLGVSRPTLMKFVESGELSSSKVGSHTRLATTAVLEFKALREARRTRAFNSLRKLDDEIDDLA